jgi:hypothetical protein
VDLGLILAFALGLVGLVAARRGPHRAAWAAVVLAGLGGLLLALGPVVTWRGRATGLFGPLHWLSALPGLDGLRAPIRWLNVSFVALGLCAARGAQALAAGLRRPIASGIPALILAPLLVHPVPAEPREALRLPPIYDEVARWPAPGALLDLLPGSGPSGGCSCHVGTRLRGALLHRRPLVGGTYARRISALQALNRETMAWPAPSAIELLRRIGVGLVLEHAPRGEIRVEGVRCGADPGHRLCALDPWPAPLVRAEDLEPVGAAPAHALRLAREPKGEGPIRVRCDGEVQGVDRGLWRTLTRLQWGSTGPALEVQLGRTCGEELAVEGGAPELLRAKAGARRWP